MKKQRIFILVLLLITVYSLNYGLMKKFENDKIEKYIGEITSHLKEVEIEKAINASEEMRYELPNNPQIELIDKLLQMTNMLMTNYVEEKIGKIDETSENEKRVAEESVHEEDTISSEPTKEKGTRAIPYKLKEQANLEFIHYKTGNTTMDLKLTELITGEEALKVIKETNQFNKVPPPGKEYVLAKFFANLKDAETEPFSFYGMLFDFVNGSGATNPESFSLVIDDDLHSDLYKGAKYEGWLYFMIDVDDENPSVVFNRGEDGETWFSLRK